MTDEFTYFCYRCGTKNVLDLELPTAPDYHHLDVECTNCGDGTHAILSKCPKCSRYVYWINDLSIPEVVDGFSRYMVHRLQVLIDQAAQHGVRLSIDTPDNYPLNATCPCGERFAIEIPIPDLDE